MNCKLDVNNEEIKGLLDCFKLFLDLNSYLFSLFLDLCPDIINIHSVASLFCCL